MRRRVYAAVVGTVSLGLQVWRGRRADRPGIVVKLSNAIQGYPAGHSVWRVCVKAIDNNGGRPDGVNGAGLETQEGSGQTFVPFKKGAADTIPGTVVPRHDPAAYVDVDALEQYGLDLKQPLVGHVDLATGERVRSKPTILRS